MDHPQQHLVAVRVEVLAMVIHLVVLVLVTPRLQQAAVARVMHILVVGALDLTLPVELQVVETTVVEEPGAGVVPAVVRVVLQPMDHVETNLAHQAQGLLILQLPLNMDAVATAFIGALATHHNSGRQILDSVATLHTTPAKHLETAITELPV
jgi:hypothetical protein